MPGRGTAAGDPKIIETRSRTTRSAEFGGRRNRFTRSSTKRRAPCGKNRKRNGFAPANPRGVCHGQTLALRDNRPTATGQRLLHDDNAPERRRRKGFDGLSGQVQRRHAAVGAGERRVRNVGRAVKFPEHPG